MRWSILLPVCWCCASQAQFPDCNNNGIDDADDISSGTPLECPPQSNARIAVCLSQWERLGRGSNLETVKACSDIIRSATETGENGDVIECLMTIAISDTQSLPSRVEAVKLASEISTRRDAQRILRTMRGLFQQLKPIERSHETENTELINWENHTLLEEFVETSINNILPVFEETDELLAFLGEYYLEKPSLKQAQRVACAQIIATCAAPIQARQHLILEIIEADTRSPIPDILMNLLDDHTIPGLRDLLRRSVRSGHFNFAAAHALAQLGDPEILADLENWRPKIEAKGSTAKHFLEDWIWRIKVQNPPTKLLEYIESIDSDRRGRRQRVWAIRRASRLAISKRSIRDAILAHNAKAKTNVERVELPRIKHAAVELGILGPSDMADVQLNQTKYTP